MRCDRAFQRHDPSPTSIPAEGPLRLGPVENNESSIGRPIGVNQRWMRRGPLAVGALSAILLMLVGLGGGASASSGTVIDGLVPDVTAVLEEPSEVGDEWLPVAQDRLQAIDGVSTATLHWPTQETTAFHLRLDDSAVARRSLDRIGADIEDALSDSLPFDNDLTVVLDGDGTTVSDGAEETQDDVIDEAQPRVLIGGRMITDHSLVDGYQATVWMLALLAATAALAVGFRFGQWEALLAGVVWPTSVLLAGSVGAQAIDVFNGTIVTTPVVAAVAGFVAAIGLGLRLLLWYESPGEADGATMVRSSLAGVGVESTLILSGFLGVLGLVWLFGGATGALVAVVVGSVIAGLFTAAVMAPLLAGLHLSRPAATGRSWSLGPNLDRPARGHLLPVSLPTGKGLSLLAVLGLGLGLLLLGGFLFRDPGPGTIDHRALDEDTDAYQVGELLVGSGDPTQGVVALLAEDTGPDWLETIAGNPSVAWIDQVDARYVAGGRQDAVEGVSLLSGSVLDSLAPAGEGDVAVDAVSVSRRALIVPAVSLRSPEGEALLNDLVQASVGQATLDGPMIDQRESQGSVLLLVFTVVLLAIVAALAVHVVTENLDHSVTTFVLRLLGGAAVAGLYSLVAGRPPVLETSAVVIILACCSGMFELEFLKAAEESPGEAGGSDAAPPLGQVATVVAALVVVAGLAVALSRWFGSPAPTGRFGMGLMVAALFELGVFALALRPVLLGQQAVFHAAARPVRRAVVPGRHRLPLADGPHADDPTWHRVVSDLLLAEFLLENDPAAARPDTVFLMNTPAHGQAVARIKRLHANGLRVSGRSPVIRRVVVIRDGAQTALSATVDDPERHLVDRTGMIHGFRHSRRRSLVLWVMRSSDGYYRVAELLETGSVLSPEAPDDRPDEVEPGPALVGSGEQAGFR